MANGPAATETRHLRTLFAVGAAGMLTDGQLLERFATRHGDASELAFAALVERHGPMVLRVARSSLLDHHLAHDAFQATFLILARKARTLWVRDSLGPWLHAVARRVASEARSDEARRKGREIVAARPEAYFPEGRGRDDRTQAIYQEIERLPTVYRLAVETIHLEGLTQHEAADRLGWPVGTLQSRLARGRQKLRDRLERRGLNPSLAILAGKSTPLPLALAASTARLAATLQPGPMASEMIAPGVLAMIETMTKGMLMTKLKLGAVALVMACGLVGSGMGLNLGRKVEATDEPAKASPSGLIDDVEISKKDVVTVGDSGFQETQPVQIEEAESGATKPNVPSDWRKAHRPSLPAESGKAALADQTPKVRPPGSPVLLYFFADWAGPCRQVRPEVDKLILKNYPVEQIDVDRFRDRSNRDKVTAVPSFVVVDSDGNELARTQGFLPASQLAAWYNHAAASRNAPAYGQVTPIVVAPEIEPEESQPDDSETSLTDAVRPRPWETVVRIKLKLSDKEWGFGSGTIISSSAEESIILTCAHTFRVKGPTQPSPKNFRVPISVDLFSSQFVGQNPATLGRAEQDIPGQVIDYDFTNNLGLIRIRPGRQLPSSPVVPASWQPRLGMTMTTVGCSQGNDATAWTTTILDPHVPMSNSSTKQSFATIKCAHQPKEGRSGGGLYTAEGYVAGVCLYADPNERVGLYAVPKAIQRLLDCNGLSALYGKKKPEDFDPDEDPPIAGRQAKPKKPLPNDSAIEPDEELLAPQPGTRSGAIRPPTDRERLDELERKLDQILKTLDALKEQKAAESPKLIELPPPGAKGVSET